MPRAKKDPTTQAPESGETTGGYFRRVFKENPSLLHSRSNDELLARWLADHPGEKKVPKNIKKHMAKVKGILRHKGPTQAAQPKKDKTAHAPAPDRDGKQAPEGSETPSGYFRRVFKENPQLLVTRSNEELVIRWLADHPGEKAMPPNIQKILSNVKGILRKKGRKKIGRPKKVEQDGAVPPVSTQPKPVKIASKGLEALEEQIDDCLTVARKMDREGLDDVIRLLRNARNGVVWKLGQ